MVNNLVETYNSKIIFTFTQNNVVRGLTCVKNSICDLILKQIVKNFNHF